MVAAAAATAAAPLATPPAAQAVVEAALLIASDVVLEADLAPEAITWLAEKGCDERMGARPLARVIQEHIKQPLADEVLFGKLKKGGTVRMTVAEDGKGLVLEPVADGPVTPRADPVPKKRRKPARRRAKAAGRATPVKKRRDGGGGEGGKKGLVPKVPLKTD